MRTALYFNSIEDFPLRNWRHCQEKGEYKYTRINESKGTEEDDVLAWINLYNEFLLEFGVNESYKELLNIKRQIAIIKCDLILGAHPQLNNQITLLELRLEEILSRNVDFDMDDSIDAIEQWRKIEVNERTMMTRKYYKLLGRYEKYVQAMKAKQVA